LLLHSEKCLKTVYATKPLNQEKYVIGSNSVSELHCLQRYVIEVGICKKRSFWNGRHLDRFCAAYVSAPRPSAIAGLSFFLHLQPISDLFVRSQFMYI